MLATSSSGLIPSKAEPSENVPPYITVQTSAHSEYIEPDVVHVMWDGKIVRSGDKNLAIELEAKGYDWIKEEIAA